MRSIKQTSLAGPVALDGIGVHSGEPVSLALHPADAGHGIVFLRTGLPDGRDRLIEAGHLAVSATELCTVLGDESRGAVSTVEHLMSALAGLGVDNVLVEIDGPEVPILDGSAALFVDAITQVGVVSLSASRRYVKVLKPVRIDHGRAFAELLPYEHGFRLDVEINFDSPLIGRQRKIVELEPNVYRREIARARTFGFMRDVERYWKAGFALGASLDNTVAIGEDGVVNAEGLRFPDEFVRHKLLDAVGDLALSQYPIIGAYRSYCGGHRMNFAVLQALFSDRTNYALVDGSKLTTAKSEGVKARREVGHADMPAGIAMPAFAPEVN
ncbi:UDP-3-O-acyl-N-acetylglucosamine deacetylase [Chelatococcus sp. GCM10030263]|uniref:UDP-3-O-acyl-N-acetylglucosamine deacetylase n=1 Tax=Chelatococcus sp. GCM10030263 TaxID=3273387 RepID=UPI00361B1C62